MREKQSMSWAENQIQSAWENGQVLDKINSWKWRKDACGAWISRDQYDNRNSDFGWEISHVLPVNEGGADERSNLRPLQWKNAAAKDNGSLTCPVMAQGGFNIDWSSA